MDTRWICRLPGIKKKKRRRRIQILFKNKEEKVPYLVSWLHLFFLGYLLIISSVLKKS